MIDRKDLDESIAELEGARNHSPQMCQRLASLYIIREKLFEQSAKNDYEYSLASDPVPFSAPELLDEYGESEFLLAVRGKIPADAWRIVDELMDTLKAVNPRVYDSVMRKMRNL